MERQATLLGRPAAAAFYPELCMNRPRHTTHIRNRVFFITVVIALIVGFWMARG